MGTIFEKIIAREIPAHIIYEDEMVVAFLDIKPVHLGHALIVPKQPFVNAFDAPGDTLAQMMKVGSLIAKRLETTLGAEGVNLIMNNGAAAGQEVFHAHLHVVPRYQDDQAFTSPHRTEVSAEDLAATAEKLRA